MDMALVLPGQDIANLTAAVFRGTFHRGRM